MKQIVGAFKVWKIIKYGTNWEIFSCPCHFAGNEPLFTRTMYQKKIQQRKPIYILFLRKFIFWKMKKKPHNSSTNVILFATMYVVYVQRNTFIQIVASMYFRCKSINAICHITIHDYQCNMQLMLNIIMYSKSLNSDLLY